MPIIHNSAEVLSKKIGNNSTIWQFVIVLPGAVIGNNCNINCHVFIENDVVIGNNVTIKSGVQIWDGLRIGNNVFIGPNVTFTNDKYPKVSGEWKLVKTKVNKEASIGANCTILPGVTIGKAALIGAGSVVTHDVPAYGIVTGNPARVIDHRKSN